MQVQQIQPGTSGYVTVTRDSSDKRPKNESHLLHMVKVELAKRGLDVIKKRMWKDGHMVADTCQYIRARKLKNNAQAFALWDDQYAVRDVAEDFRRLGKVTLRLEHLTTN